MSGRTVPRSLLVALLTAALAAPAAAQETRPEAPMPRAKANRGLTIEFAFAWGEKPVATPVMPEPVPPELPVPPMTPPAPPGSLMLGNFKAIEVIPELFRAGPFTSEPACPSSCGFGSYCAPHIPRLVAPPPPRQLFSFGDSSRIQLVVAEDVLMPAPTCPPCPLPRIAPNPVLGTWYRELPGVVIAATFTDDELKLCVTQCADGHTMTITMTAHYTLTKDGLVFGAITGADVDLKGGPNAPDTDTTEVSAGVQALVDAPFAFRTKMTSAGLMVSGVKCGAAMAKGETNVFGGMFKPAKDGRVPTPVGLKTTVGSKVDAPPFGAVIGGLMGTATGAQTGDWAGRPVPTTPDCQRVGIDFSTNPPTMSPPPAPGGAVAPPCQLPMPQPVKPVGCGIPTDGTKQLAGEAFGQLLRQSGVTMPSVMGGMTLPTGRYLEHFPQYFAPDPAFPLPRELASQEDPDGAARRAGGPLLGVTARVACAGPVKGVAESRWCRDVAGKQCVLKLAPDHFTLTVIESHDESGKVSTASLVITADYHTTRDGLTAVGLITSVDVRYEGDFPPEDSKPFFEMLGELQKALEDKPFALTFRSYDDALVIGNVRMPSVSDRMEVQPAGYLAGRYALAGDKLPKPKVLKVSEPKALPPVPSIYAPPSAGTQGLTFPPGSAYPQPYYVAPAPPAPNGEMLPPQALPSPRIVPSSASEPVPSMTEPTAPPVPRMPQPIPPALSSDETKAPEVIGGDKKRPIFNPGSRYLRE